MKLGRIKARVPGVGGMTTNWAPPCTPYADPGVGVLLMPPLYASVWIEFEGGDPKFPIWSGCFWERAEDMPAVVMPRPAR
jgi:Type VI secretion system/phage-baseplate injector OB domain